MRTIAAAAADDEGPGHNVVDFALTVDAKRSVESPARDLAFLVADKTYLFLERINSFDHLSLDCLVQSFQ